MTRKERKIWIKKLKPFWKKRSIMYDKFRKNEVALEDWMRKNIGEDLEFIYGDMDMGCIGIGHIDDGGRKGFPLFQQDELE